MKKTLVAAILGLAAIASVQAQGVVTLYNYNQPSKLITYGANSGGSLGAGIEGGVWTIGIYSAAGDVSAAVNAGMAGDGGFGLVPTLNLESETTVLISGYPGLYGPTAVNVNFSGLGTFVVVAYNGTSYTANNTTVRGHSAAFTLAANALPASPVDIGTATGLGSFAVVGVPEPSTFALAGLGLASLLIFRRRK